MKLFHMLGISMLVIFLVACDQAPTTQAPLHPDYPMQVRKVVDDVYAVITPARDFPNKENKGWNSNSSFVVTDEGVLVIDTGSSDLIGQVLRKAIATVTDKPVRWVVNTHGHGDHWLGNKVFADEGAEIMASDEVAARIEEEPGYWIDLFNMMTGGFTGESTPVVPGTIIEGRTTRQLGNVSVEFIPSQDSHSPGDILVWLPKQKVLVTGDVVYTDRFPGTFESRMQQWINFLAELKELPAVAVIPGHGDLGTMAAIEQQYQLLETMMAEVVNGYEDDLQAFEIVPVVKAKTEKFAPYFTGYEKYIAESVSHIYLQIEADAF